MDSPKPQTDESSPSGSTEIAAPSTPTYPHWHDLISGAAAGFGARAITAPLDLLKIRRQLQPSPSTVSTFTTAAGKGVLASSSAANATTSFAEGERSMFRQLYAIAEKEGGMRSLFRGNVAASYLWMGYSVAQFWLYGYTSQYLHQYALNSKHLTNDQNYMKVASGISFTAGAISGLCATVITYPFDLCRTIFAARGLFPIAASNVTWSNYTTNLALTCQQEYIQRRPPKTLREFSSQMYQHKGLQGFYAGSTPGLLQIIPYMGINFALHDALVMMSGSSDSRVSGAAGMFAGLISKFVIYPLDTVKKRLQAQAFWASSPGDEATTRRSTKYTTASPKNPSMYSNRRRVVGAVNKRVVKPTGGTAVYEGMIDCFEQILRKEGIAAFYKGLIPSLLKSSVSTGASFWLFTLTKNILQSIHDSNNL